MSIVGHSVDRQLHSHRVSSVDNVPLPCADTFKPNTVEYAATPRTVSQINYFELIALDTIRLWIFYRINKNGGPFVMVY